MDSVFDGETEKTHKYLNGSLLKPGVDSPFFFNQASNTSP